MVRTVSSSDGRRDAGRGEVLGRRMVFIIGSPRSGTTWLQDMLGSHPNVATNVELKLFVDFTYGMERGWDRVVRGIEKTGVPLGLPTVWSEEEFLAFLREFLTRVYGRVLEKQGKPEAGVIVDKHPAHAKLTDHIDRLVPGARFIHMVRDGRDCVASMLAASRRRWGRPWAPTEASEAARIWKEHVSGALEAARFEGRYLEVRYEDLLTDGPAVLRTAFRFADCEITEREAREIVEEHDLRRMKRGQTGLSKGIPQEFFRKGGHGGWRSTLSPVDRYRLHREAGDLLRELGYAEEGWWATRPWQRITLPAVAAADSCASGLRGLARRFRRRLARIRRRAA